MHLLILGPGCTRCLRLAELVEQAARELDLEYQIEKVTDLRRIMALRVMMTPALVVNGTVKIAGSVPTLHELKQILHEAAAAQPS